MTALMSNRSVLGGRNLGGAAVVVLTTLAFAGAAYFGSTFVQRMTLADQGLLASIIGLTYWSIGPILTWRGIDPVYRRPLVHAALAMSVLTLFASILSTLGSGTVPLSSALALLA